MLPQAGFEVTEEWAPPFANQSATCHMPHVTSMLRCFQPFFPGWASLWFCLDCWYPALHLSWQRLTQPCGSSFHWHADVLCKRGNSQHDTSFHASEQETLPCSRVDGSKYIPEWAFRGEKTTSRCGFKYSSPWIDLMVHIHTFLPRTITSLSKNIYCVFKRRTWRAARTGRNQIATTAF